MTSSSDYTLSEDQYLAFEEIRAIFHKTRLSKDVVIDPEIIAVLLGYPVNEDSKKFWKLRKEIL